MKDFAFIQQMLHPVTTIQSIARLKGGEHQFRSYPMLKLHIIAIAVSLVVSLPLSFISMAQGLTDNHTFSQMLHSMILAVSIPFFGITAAVVLFEIYCRKIQTSHVYYRTYGQLVSIREIAEWISPKLLDYFTPWDDREGTSRRDQWWIQNVAHGEHAIESHASRSKHQHQLTILTRHDRHPSDEDVLHNEMRQVVIGVGDRTRTVSRYRASAMSIPSVTKQFTAAMSIGTAGISELSTGEGSLYDAHLAGGPNVRLEYQIGTGYFGCRNPDGTFSLATLVETVRKTPQIYSIQIKLSQGAKQDGGKLLANKNDDETALVRGIQPHVDCFTPGVHTAFNGFAGLPLFLEQVREATNLPVGIKMAVGSAEEIDAMCRYFAAYPNGIPDTIQVDFGDGTGASFSEVIESSGRKDIRSLQIVDILLRKHGIRDRVKLIASGRIFKPNDAVRAFALGADIIATARGFKYAAGCGGIRRCHIGSECISGIAGNGYALDPVEKGAKIRTWLTEVFSRTAHLLSMTGVHSIEDLIGTRDRYVDLGDIPVLTPRDIEDQIGLEQRDFRKGVELWYKHGT